MRVDTLAHVKNRLSAVIEGLGEEPLFITRKGRVAAVLQAVTDEDAEDYLLRNSPRFWRLIESRRAQAAAGQVAPFAADQYTEEVGAGAAMREAPAPYRSSGRGKAAGRTRRASPRGR
jgi:PHD/YefM family antitoxin component YafN of YafNO toxin-antitoxin module